MWNPSSHRYLGPRVVRNTMDNCRHIESLELRLESTERRLEQLTRRLDRVEGGSESPEHRSQRRDSLGGGRISDASIVEDADPGVVIDSADATDGLGSVIFTKEERADAGFFGICPPRFIPWPSAPCLPMNFEVHHPTYLSRATYSVRPLPSSAGLGPSPFQMRTIKLGVPYTATCSCFPVQSRRARRPARETPPFANHLSTFTTSRRLTGRCASSMDTSTTRACSSRTSIATASSRRTGRPRPPTSEMCDKLGSGCLT